MLNVPNTTNQGLGANLMPKCTGSNGKCGVIDQGNNRVQKFDSTGVYLAQWGSIGTGDGQFFEPQKIAVDSAGNVFVTENNNFRVQKFTDTGT